MAARQKRLVFTSGLKNPFAMQSYEGGVYAIVGPFENFTDDVSFQDELQALCLKYNRDSGFLTKQKYNQLIKAVEARGRLAVHAEDQ